MISINLARQNFLELFMSTIAGFFESAAHDINFTKNDNQTWLGTSINMWIQIHPTETNVTKQCLSSSSTFSTTRNSSTCHFCLPNKTHIAKHLNKHYHTKNKIKNKNFYNNKVTSIIYSYESEVTNKIKTTATRTKVPKDKPFWALGHRYLSPDILVGACPVRNFASSYDSWRAL